ncbi:cutinase family protein [Gordonia sp. TBRC 11910]|uniref:Cutinase family protein n=1 Tax=Gordonia asplenii TaxID=2725283 RepID=A0A848KXC2_9ACTN|nr:cutinase family protein [Gordonia asplenii]NMO02979.1 cutinase family protein [Gordonia asplenii]
MSARKALHGKPKRKFSRWLLLIAALIVIAIVLIVILIINTLSPPPITPPPTSPPTTGPHRPDSQAASCPDVETLVIPGTWESKATDDPLHPHANPRSLLLRVSTALQHQFPTSRTEVYTVPYMAQFRNPTNLADTQADYNTSRAQGYQRASARITAVNAKCPLTRFVIIGFSQGAVIGGDLASIIGTGRGVLPKGNEDLVLGVGLIADGRRQSGQQVDVGPDPDGVGAEIALAGMGSLVPGITFNGPRQSGYGELRDRVQSICAPGDLICDSPTVANPLRAVTQLAGAINNPIHAMYATPKYWQLNGSTATQWMYGWSAGLIADAPHPKHS